MFCAALRGGLGGRQCLSVRASLVKPQHPASELRQMCQSSGRKDHKSALCIIPPRHVWDAIQNIRLFNDKGFVRWPPHINLLYPFFEDSGETFQQCTEAAAQAVTDVQPFDVTLSELRFFDHGRSCTLWLEPDSQGLKDLQQKLVKAFPDCTDLSEDATRGIAEFTPHLSLGQWPSADAASQAQQAIRQKWKDLSFTVDRVYFISRAGFLDPYVIRHSVALGQGQSKEVNVPYIATVGPWDASSLTADLVTDYGIGAMQEGGVWYFAFGANMTAKKLTESRGIKPFEAAKGFLPGWRLAFNHKGGMGTILEGTHWAGQASKTGQPGKGVHGVLHRLRPLDLARLTHMEHEYRPTEILVEADGGKRSIRAVAFISPPEMHINEGLPPPDRYLKLLQRGAHEAKLDDDYTKWLDAMDCVPSNERGQEYYTAPDGTRVKGRKRFWTGGDTVDSYGKRQKGKGSRGGRRGGRQGGRGGRGGEKY